MFQAFCWAQQQQLLLHPFHGLFSRTTWVRHQKGKPFWILLEQQMMRKQWHQLDHMQIICTSFQTDNHASTLPLSFYRPDALPAAQSTASKHCWAQRESLTDTILKRQLEYTKQELRIYIHYLVAGTKYTNFPSRSQWCSVGTPDCGVRDPTINPTAGSCVYHNSSYSIQPLASAEHPYCSA